MFCPDCNYSTDDTSNFNRHMLSKRHNKPVNSTNKSVNSTIKSVKTTNKPVNSTYKPVENFIKPVNSTDKPVNSTENDFKPVKTTDYDYTIIDTSILGKVDEKVKEKVKKAKKPVTVSVKEDKPDYVVVFMVSILLIAIFIYLFRNEFSYIVKRYIFRDETAEYQGSVIV